jgi:hypothetical protein
MSRKQNFDYEDQDLKKRPTTPTYMDDYNQIKVPS